jgi:regulator of PEP synthase PpsR (kinase-PPPase family)
MRLVVLRCGMSDNKNSLEELKKGQSEFFVYLVSDATGTTLQGLARACLAQFDNIYPVERFWPMVRSMAQLDQVIEDIKENPGPVLFTLVDKDMRVSLRNVCYDLRVPCIPVLEPIIRNLSSYLGLQSKGIPGLQHTMDEAYFERISAVDFALGNDDGKSFDELEEADVILVGVSRTSKTPTCMFLAQMGIKAANIPITPGVPFPEKVVEYKNPLFVGLTESPDRLVQVRRNRLQADEKDKLYDENEYLDHEHVVQEVRDARRLFSKHDWPVIDVTRKSVEETTAEILLLLQKHRGKLKK